MMSGGIVVGSIGKDHNIDGVSWVCETFMDGGVGICLSRREFVT
jgi:hypothetical protein